MRRLIPLVAAIAGLGLAVAAHAVPVDAPRAPEAAPGPATAGMFLVATERLTDPNFAHGVVYMVRHGPEGAFGLVVNRPVGRGSLGQLLTALGIASDGPSVTAEMAVHLGGPVERGLGFVLHTPDYAGPDTVPVGDGLALTTHMDVLKALAAGEGPRRSLFLVGYAGWGPGQLDREINEGSWLIAPFDPDLLFDATGEDMWRQALEWAGLPL